MGKIIQKTVLLIYVLMVLWMVFVGKHRLAAIPIENIDARINLLPFASITEWIKRLLSNDINVDIVLRNIVGNLLLLVPLGVFLPSICSHSHLKQFPLILVSIAFFIDFVQVILQIGFFDIDAILLRSIGAVGGWSIGLAVEKRKINRKA